MTWQPIETAPKDGNGVLAFGPNKTIRVCKWSKNCKRFVGAFSWLYGKYEQPTHWMPLPEPPK